MTNHLYRILVPTKYEDTQAPVSTKHHKEWDKYVMTITNGLTILKPTTKGLWVHEGKIYEDRVIPVEIFCTDKEIECIAKFTKKHYRQISVMYAKLSSEVFYV
jgi:hypothetical protein